MNSIEFINVMKDVTIIMKFIEFYFIIICAHYTFIKINNDNLTSKDISFILLFAPVITVISEFVRIKIRIYLSWLVAILLICGINRIFYKKEMTYILLCTIISISISYVLYTISVMIAFLPNIFFKLNNDIISLIVIIVIYLIITYRIFKIKKIKHGFCFLKQKIENSYFSIIILTIGCLILFLLISFQGYKGQNFAKLGTIFVIFSIALFIIIRELIQLYYKQNLLLKDLEATKKELESKKQEIFKLEKENLEFSKTSHSLAHKQKALEFKLEQLMKKDIDVESKETIKEEIQKVSKELYKEPNEVKLAKTEIESIDNMFSYMQTECIKNNIKFELQVVGNIYYMINNLISENDLEILIADHIKDAIIAINNSDNLNRSILVRIGKIDNVYSLYIYDSGMEFEKEVLDNIGKKPITTHADTGGTGMGFMNTFDTLNKTKASFIINEIGKPCEDNYTKVLIFEFDNQNEFKVNSYKNEVVV